MKVNNTIANNVLGVSLAFLILVGGIFFWLFNQDQSGYKTCATPDPIPFCGTKNVTDEAQKGKQVFNSTCAACHTLDRKMTGPALRDTDSVVYWKWMGKKKGILDSTQFHKMGIDYHRMLTATNLQESDLKNVFSYIGKGK